MKLSILLAGTFLAHGIFASFHQIRGNEAQAPCAVVSQSASAALATAPSSTPTVDAQLAYDCLTSVPLDAAAATALVEAMLPYLEWQTDTSYLKDPPSSYLEPAVDIWGSFHAILSNIKNGSYANEHAFQADLYRTVNLVHDGHFRFFPDLLSKAISFGRPFPIVSVSMDGVDVPKVYSLYDIRAYNSANSGVKPSALSEINGEDVYEFLENWAQLGALQEPDALYNTVFYELAFDAQSETTRWLGYFAGSGRFGYIYPGPNTTIGFENGTVSSFANIARIIGDFSGVVDGKSFYKKFCTGSTSSADTTQSTVTALLPAATTTAYGYPTPVVISSDQQVSGYFLDDDPDYEDVAVLSMVSFDPDYPVEFQSVIQTLISDAKAAGKTKLVIDLSSNGGGIILTGYDAFRQLFPQIVQDGFTRFREHEAFDVLSKQISAISADFSPNTASDDQINAYESILNYRYDLNLTDGKFLTYEDKFAPEEFNGDKFTQILRWNLNDPLTTTNDTFGLGETITGYGDRQNFTQPFAAEDIILVYDGYCASTCTIFSEFMRIQAGVKSIAFGGRPNTDAIQSIGGTKGANNYAYDYVLYLAEVALEYRTPGQDLSAITAYTSLPIDRSTDTSLNVRDNILPDHLSDGLPSQFLYEEADCRLFYEPDMITDVRSIWKKAADVAWGEGKCVAGTLSSTNETSIQRKRKSEESKFRARSEERVSLEKKGLESLSIRRPLNPELGRKVPI